MVDATASKIVKAGLTTYFFDIKGTKDVKPFLVITESYLKGKGSERQRRLPVEIIFTYKDQSPWNI